MCIRDRIIVLTNYTGDVQVLRALKAGARGYILKGHVHRELLDAIRAVHAGQKRIPPEIAADLAEHAVDDELTPREIDAVSYTHLDVYKRQVLRQIRPSHRDIHSLSYRQAEHE